MVNTTWQKKRLLSDDVILLHDSERSHFASATIEAIRQLTKVDLLPRPLSSIHSGTGTMRLLHVCCYKKKHCVYDDESVMKKREQAMKAQRGRSRRPSALFLKWPIPRISYILRLYVTNKMHIEQKIQSKNSTPTCFGIIVPS